MCSAVSRFYWCLGKTGNLRSLIPWLSRTGWLLGTFLFTWFIKKNIKKSTDTKIAQILYTHQYTASVLRIFFPVLFPFFYLLSKCDYYSYGQKDSVKLFNV